MVGHGVVAAAVGEGIWQQRVAAGDDDLISRKMIASMMGLVELWCVMGLIM